MDTSNGQAVQPEEVSRSRPQADDEHSASVTEGQGFHEGVSQAGAATEEEGWPLELALLEVRRITDFLYSNRESPNDLEHDWLLKDCEEEAIDMVSFGITRMQLHDLAEGEKAMRKLSGLPRDKAAERASLTQLWTTGALSREGYARALAELENS